MNTRKMIVSSLAVAAIVAANATLADNFNPTVTVSGAKAGMSTGSTRVEASRPMTMHSISQKNQDTRKRNSVAPSQGGSPFPSGGGGIDG